jgi:Tfp pilus assembly protein PilN
MKHISLLPYEYKSQRAMKRKFKVMAVIMGICIFILVFAYQIVRIVTSVPNSQIAVLKSESLRLQNEIDELMPYSQQAENIKKMNALVKKAVDKQPDWINLFLLFSENIPTGLKITEISAKSGDKPSVAVEGTANEHDTVVGWMEYLKKQEFVTDLKLQYSQAAFQDATGSKVKFLISASISPDKTFKPFKEVE